MTSYIQNSRYSNLFKGFSLLQLLCNLMKNRPKSLTDHTANCWNQEKTLTDLYLV